MITRGRKKHLDHHRLLEKLSLISPFLTPDGTSHLRDHLPSSLACSKEFHSLFSSCRPFPPQPRQNHNPKQPVDPTSCSIVSAASNVVCGGGSQAIETNCPLCKCSLSNHSKWFGHRNYRKCFPILKALIVHGFYQSRGIQNSVSH